MKFSRIACALTLALSLSGCGLFGITPEQAEPTRAKLEQAVTFARGVLTFAKMGAVAYSQLPPCGGTVVVCADPAKAALALEGVAALDARLMDAEAALKQGIDDATRAGILLAAIQNAVNDVNRILDQIKGTPGARQFIVEE
jgi:hypothetical protein